MGRQPPLEDQNLDFTPILEEQTGTWKSRAYVGSYWIILGPTRSYLVHRNIEFIAYGYAIVMKTDYFHNQSYE